ASLSVHLRPFFRLVLGVMPFTGMLGFITPMLVDRFSAGDPARAGTAYAVNVAGCILGPLLAGFGLLPFISERWALIALTLPWLLVGLAPLRRRGSVRTSSDHVRTAAPTQTPWRARLSVYAALALAA